MTTNPSPKTTSAFFLQAMLSFGVALAVVVVGEVSLRVPAWPRAFLALGTLSLVSSSFPLAKVVRDQQETENVVSRIDQARLERLLAEFDPYRVPTVPEPPAAPASSPFPVNQYPAAQHPAAG